MPSAPHTMIHWAVKAESRFRFDRSLPLGLSHISSDWDAVCRMWYFFSYCILQKMNSQQCFFSFTSPTSDKLPKKPQLYYKCYSSAKFSSIVNFQNKIIPWSFLNSLFLLAQETVWWLNTLYVTNGTHMTLVLKGGTHTGLSVWLIPTQCNSWFLPSTPGSHGGFAYIITLTPQAQIRLVVALILFHWLCIQTGFFSLLGFNY